MNKALLPTHIIANKGFRGMRRFVARFSFSCNLIGNRPQSLTGHIVKRYILFGTSTPNNFIPELITLLTVSDNCNLNANLFLSSSLKISTVW